MSCFTVPPGKTLIAKVQHEQILCSCIGEITGKNYLRDRVKKGLSIL